MGGTSKGGRWSNCQRSGRISGGLLLGNAFVGINGWHGNNIFFLDIFCFMLWHLAEDKIRQLLGKRLQKHMQKEHTKSLNKCFINICWKRGLQNQQRKAKLLEV